MARHQWPMRHAILSLALLLVACGPKQAEPENAVETAAQAKAELAVFAGQGRNRLCLDRRNGRAAFITYGTGDENCSVSGSLQGSGANASLIPDGDESCRIELRIATDRVQLGQASPACAYYCGPSAGYAASEFRRTDDEARVEDLAGDRLC